MMNTTNQQTYLARFLKCVLICSAVVLCLTALISAQSKIIRPETQTNSAPSTGQPPVVSLRMTTSPQGARIIVTSDHFFSGYESYRRSDRFYVKLPAANLPSVAGMHGRGFTDIKAQREGDGLLLSFRLEPGASAHVEQHGNEIHLVITLLAATVAGPNDRPNTVPAARVDLTNHAREANQRNTTPGATAKNSPTPAAKSASNQSSQPTAKVSASPKPSPKPSPSPTKKASPAVSSAATVSAKPTPVNQPTVAAAQSGTQTQSASGSFKERLRYWSVWARLNWIPLAIAIGVLFIFTLFMIQRRRARAPLRARKRPQVKVAKPAIAVAVAKPSAEPETVAAAEIPAAIIAASPATNSNVKAENLTAAGAARQARAAAITDQIKHVMAGEKYDAAVIGSQDSETRRLVSAELLSALVGRSEQRREQARAAFMQHGYFDDATRDLRIADSAHERAAAARRLSFVRDREATPHLIAALEDRDPDVRRTAVEALMDLRDASAIGPLNSLLQTETDRKVSRTLIKHAIESCATGEVGNPTPPAVPLPEFSSRPIETEREVIEL
jgi:hypothetical protein